MSSSSGTSRPAAPARPPDPAPDTEYVPTNHLTETDGDTEIDNAGPEPELVRIPSIPPAPATLGRAFKGVTSSLLSYSN